MGISPVDLGPSFVSNPPSLPFFFFLPLNPPLLKPAEYTVASVQLGVSSWQIIQITLLSLHSPPNNETVGKNNGKVPGELTVILLNKTFTVSLLGCSYDFCVFLSLSS